MITFKAKDQAGEIINSALSPFSFPAGEVHIKVSEDRTIQPTEIAIFQPSPASLHEDLFQLAMWANYLEEQEDTGTPKKVIILPYVPGARADRGNPFGLRIYMDFLSRMDVDQIIVFDPHSGVFDDEASIHRNLFGVEYTIVRSQELFAQGHIRSLLKDYDGIIAPDKGAVNRATYVAELEDLPVYTAEKTRDFTTGKLTGFKLEGLPKDGRYLIVDDICDGGGTFMGLAAALELPKEQIDLYISHGVFSGKANYLLPNSFGKIYTTNSFKAEDDLNYEFRWEKYLDDYLDLKGEEGQFPDQMGNDQPFTRFDVIRLLESKIV